MGEISERTKIFSELAAEVAFAVLPLVVVLLVTLDVEHSNGFFGAPEWSFGASILFGQTLVKFVSGLVTGGHAAKGPVALAVSLLVVFGLTPSLIILVMTLNAAHAGVVPRWLQVSQVLLFCGSAIVYMLLGTIGEVWKRN